MYIQVRFRKVDPNTGKEYYGGAPYTYICTLMGVRVGDEVVAPTRGGDQRAVVVALNAPKPEFECKVIKAFWKEEEQ